MSNISQPSGRMPLVGRTGFLVSAMACLLVGLLVAQIAAEGVRRTMVGTDEQVLYIPSGAVLKRLALSFDSLLADVYWIRAIQHYGRTKSDERSRKQYELLYPLLDITTTLDPRFNIAYRFGAIFLTEAYPDGPGRPDQAVALLQKAARNMPERWQYLQDIGFVYYWWLRDYDQAAHWFQRASELPGAPWWLTSLAANTLAVGGNRADSRVLWRQIHQTADNEWMRNEAQRRLFQLDALDEIDRLTQLQARFLARRGRPPSSWREMRDALSDSDVPRDPTGHPYILDTDSGTITVSSDSPLFPLPDAPMTGAP